MALRLAPLALPAADTLAVAVTVDVSVLDGDAVEVALGRALGDPVAVTLLDAVTVALRVGDTLEDAESVSESHAVALGVALAVEALLELGVELGVDEEQGVKVTHAVELA